MKKTPKTYDEAVEHLEKLVARIQEGRMGLEEMRGEVKQALDLIRSCREKLREIEADMKTLLEEDAAGAGEEE